MLVRFAIKQDATTIPQRAVQYMRNYRITKVTDKRWLVSKKADGNYYTVVFSENGFTCNCPDFKFRKGDGRFCKHIYHILFNSSFEDVLATLLLISQPELKNFLEIVRE